MQTFSQLVIVTCQGIGIMAVLAIGFGSVQRQPLRWYHRSLLQGLMFGAGPVVLSLFPVQLHNVPIDGRAIFVGLAGAFAGLPAMLAAAAVSMGARLWMTGLATPVAMFSAILGGLIGLSWLKFIRPRLGITVPSLALLGAMIASNLLLAFLLPPAAALHFLADVGPATICASMIGAIVFGSLLKRELALITREKFLEAAAMRDPLTGLRNRRSFDAEVAKSLLDDEPTCLLILDVDHFKEINDRYGHAVGDLALRAVALALQSSVRRDDIVGRIGGEEFAILLPATDLATAIEIATTVRQRIQNSDLKADGHKVAMTASLGLAQAQPSDSGMTLFSAADTALYAAKRDGRNCVRLAASPKPDAKAAHVGWAA